MQHNQKKKKKTKTETKAIITKDSSLTILSHFMITYILEVAYIYRIWWLETLWNGVSVHIPSQLHVQGLHSANLTWAMESTDTRNQPPTPSTRSSCWTSTSSPLDSTDLREVSLNKPSMSPPGKPAIFSAFFMHPPLLRGKGGTVFTYLKGMWVRCYPQTTELRSCLRKYFPSFAWFPFEQNLF